MAFVYQHRKPGEMLPFYIGISNKDKRRPYSTIRPHSPIWTNIYKKYGFEVDILIEGCTLNQAKEIEANLISAYGRIDNGTGILANMTDGGDGTVGVIRSEETKKKMSKAKKGRFSGENSPMYKKQFSEETKKKMSKAKEGKYIGKSNPMYGKTGKKCHMYGCTGGKHPSAKAVTIQYTSGETKIFPSKVEAAIYLQIDTTHLGKIILGNRKMYKRFVNEGINSIQYN